MTPVANAPRRYFIELMLAMALYAAALFVRHGWFHHTGDPELRLVIMLLPILPVFLAALAIYRFYYRMDEMHRLQTLESLAFSAGVTALFAISWRFLEDVGFPHLTLMWVWPVMGVCWLVSRFYFIYRESAAEHAVGALAKDIAQGLLLVALGTASYTLLAAWVGWPYTWRVLILVATLVFLALVGLRTFSKKSASC